MTCWPVKESVSISAKMATSSPAAFKIFAIYTAILPPKEYPPM
jgi:hypothetical protein